MTLTMGDDEYACKSMGFILNFLAELTSKSRSKTLQFSLLEPSWKINNKLWRDMRCAQFPSIVVMNQNAFVAG